jgi:hypothetical protein
MQVVSSFFSLPTFAFKKDTLPQLIFPSIFCHPSSYMQGSITSNDKKNGASS